MRTQIFCLPFLMLAASTWVAAQDGPKPPIPPVPAPIAVPAPAPPRPAFAQPVQRVVMQPIMRRTPGLNDLVLAKIDLNKETPKVILMIESFRDEARKAKVTVLRTEQRTREVEVDGKTVTQTYTVNVPVVEEREITTKVPAGRKPVTIDANEVEFYRLDGEAISIEQAGKSLEQLRPVFLLDQGSEPLPLADIVQQAMRDDCLVMTTSKTLHRANNRIGVRQRVPLPRAILP